MGDLGPMAVAVEIVEEMQGRVCHWRGLRDLAARDYGPGDEVTLFYASKVEDALRGCRLLGVEAEHLA